MQELLLVAMGPHLASSLNVQYFCTSSCNGFSMSKSNKILRD